MGTSAEASSRYQERQCAPSKGAGPYTLSPYE